MRHPDGGHTLTSPTTIITGSDSIVAPNAPADAVVKCARQIFPALAELRTLSEKELAVTPCSCCVLDSGLIVVTDLLTAPMMEHWSEYVDSRTTTGDWPVTMPPNTSCAYCCNVVFTDDDENDDEDLAFKRLLDVDTRTETASSTPIKIEIIVGT